MMKRLSLKSLRLSSHHKDDTQSADDLDEIGDQDQPPPTSTDLGSSQRSQTTQEMSRSTSIQSESSGVPTKRERKGFFQSLRRKLTGNFRGKRDSVTGSVIEDDSSSDNRDDGSLHCTRAVHSPRKPRHAGHGDRGSRLDPPIPIHADSVQEKQEASHKKRHLSIEVSKSEDSSSTPTEEQKVQTMFLTDVEYGHTSAPTSVMSEGTLDPARGTEIGPSSVVVCRLPGEGSGAVSTEESMPPETLPLSLDKDVHGNVSSDSETQGACAPKSYSLQEDSDSPPTEPPPPPPSVSDNPLSQGNVYEPYDLPPERPRFNQHLSLIGGGLNEEKLRPVYDQLKEPPKSWSLTRELFKLSKYGWYWGPITRVEAEDKLINQTDGAFLVRDSSDERYLLSLSFRSYGRTLHTRIEHCNGVFSFYAQPESEGYFSIVDLIEHSMNDSQTGVFCYSRARTPGSPSFPVRLTKPVSRFTHVRSLQYLCRFVIRQYTRFDHIQKLPLPTQIRGWLEENQY